MKPHDQDARLIRLVYASTCAPTLAATDVQAILSDARRYNQIHAITGMLCWSGEFFLQCLEGPRRPVTALFSHIGRDPRHQDIELIVAAPTAVRWFVGWAMGFTREMVSAQGDRRSPAPRFSPYELEAEDLLSVFERLSGSAQRL